MCIVFAVLLYGQSRQGDKIDDTCRSRSARSAAVRSVLVEIARKQGDPVFTDEIRKYVDQNLPPVRC